MVEVEGSGGPAPEVGDGAGLRWTDDHCHLPTEPAACAETVAAARAAGVTRLVTVGCDVPSSVRCAEQAAAHDGVWAVAGVHPHDARTVVDPVTGAVDLSAIEALLERPEVVAVGECGLDYHYDHSPRDQQRAVFAAQVALAHARGLPLVIHTREAWDDTFAVLEAEGIPDRTVFHCFSGGALEARRCLDLGAHLSFSGIVSFPSAGDLREAAALCPPDRLLVETDSPYLAPVPHRGRRNQPAFVTHVGEAVAAARGEDVRTVAAATWATASRVYGLA